MGKSTCSADDCDRPTHARGLCGMHYKRLMAGSTRQGPPLHEPAEIRFWRHVDRRGPGECWPWTSTKAQGYGTFRTGGRRSVRAHRFAYELLVGPIPDGLQIDHVWARGCTRRDCVNPAHLEPVTGRVNKLRGGCVSAVNAVKTQCPRGHDYDRVYTRRDGRRERICSICAREQQRQFYERARARRSGESES